MPEQKLNNKSGVLSRCQPTRAITATCKQELTRFASRQPQVLIDRHSCLVGQLEPDRPTCLLLANRGAVQRVTVRRNIIDANGNDVTATQLSIARLNSARSRLRSSICSLVRIDQAWLGRRGGLGPTSLPLFQGVRQIGRRHRSS